MTDPRAGRGAGVGGPADTQTEPARPTRPPRPVAVELASAFLVVNGLVSTILSLSLGGRLADQTPGVEPLAVASIALGLATTVLGVLLRYGRGWIVTINVTAVAGFLELMSGIPAGWISGTLDVAVVLVLVWHRPWFAWSPDEAETDEAD